MAVHRVIIADSREIPRRGLRGIFEGTENISVVGEAETPAEAAKLTRLLAPDIVVLALVEPIEPGLDLINTLSQLQTPPQVLVMSPTHNLDLACQALRRGATGFLLSDAESNELVRAVNEVGPGRAVLDPRIASLVVQHFISEESVTQEPEKILTPRQQEVLQLLAEGNASKQIASRLHISSRTVDTHRHQIMQKLKLRGIADLTRFAIRHGLAELESPAP
ncbi:MAG: response regulator transcription factor [Algisphaera sp.]